MKMQRLLLYIWFLTPALSPAMEAPVTDFKTVRAAVAAFEKGDPITKLDAFHYVAQKTRSTGAGDVWEAVRALVPMAAVLKKQDEWSEFFSEAIAVKDAAWASAACGAAADAFAERGAFDEAAAAVAPVLENTDRFSAAQRAQKKNAPAEADAFLSKAFADSFDPATAPDAFALLAVQRADLLRTQLGKGDEAAALYAAVLDLGATAPEREFSLAAERLAALQNEAGKRDEAAETILLAIGRSSFLQGGLAARLVETGAAADQLGKAVETLRRRMAAPPESEGEYRGRAERIQPEIVTLLLAAGRPADAFVEARTLAFQASDQRYALAAELVARALKALDGNLGRANAWLASQSAAVTNAPSPVLLSLPAASDPVRAEAYAALGPIPSEWGALLARSRQLLWLDRPAEALDAAVAAFAVCPLREDALQACANAAARPLLVATRDDAAANALVDWLLFGPSAGAEDPLPGLRARLAYPEKSVEE